MNNYEKPNVEFVQLIADEEIAGSLKNMVDGVIGIQSNTMFP